MLTAAITSAVQRHKEIAEEFINASTVEVTITTETLRTTPLVGGSLFADLDDAATTESYGPFKVIWTDADSARVGMVGREINLLTRFLTATVLVKFWLDDVLVDKTDPYGQTYLDKALAVVMSSRDYEVLGYDRFGLGTVQPYMIAVALRGTHEK